MADPYWSSVKLLLGFEGADASTTVTDESSAAHGTASVFGNAQIDTAQFQFGTSSALFDGSGDGFTFANNADYNFGTGAFTVECWIRTTTVGGTRFILGKWGNAVLGWILYQSGSALSFNVSTTGTDNIVQLSGGTLTTNTWTAVCVDYDGSKYRLYKDGAMVGSSTTARNIFAASVPLAVGMNSENSSFYFSGWIDEVRITKGVARYASDSGYTVATVAFPRSAGQMFGIIGSGCGSLGVIGS